MIIGGSLIGAEPHKYRDDDDDDAVRIIIHCKGIANDGVIMARLKDEEHWTKRRLGVFLCFRTDIPADMFDALCDGANGVPTSAATIKALAESAQQVSDAKAEAHRNYDELSQERRLGYERRDKIRELQAEISRLECELADAKKERKDA
jgi:hypothetical protein